MELGVRLNLLCSRVDEVMPAVQMFLADFMESLATVQDPFSNFLEAFRPALDTASIAHNANLQAEAAKVVAMCSYVCLCIRMIYSLHTAASEATPPMHLLTAAMI